MVVNGQLHAPVALTPGKEPLVPIGLAGWASELFFVGYLKTTQFAYFEFSRKRIHEGNSKAVTVYKKHAMKTYGGMKHNSTHSKPLH
jgi:hypothetical protein